MANICRSLRKKKNLSSPQVNYPYRIYGVKKMGRKSHTWAPLSASCCAHEASANARKLYVWTIPSQGRTSHRSFMEQLNAIQRWALALTSWSNVQHQSNTRPLIERIERMYFFEKPKAKIVHSTPIFVDHN
jgi:hypothetical protein